MSLDFQKKEKNGNQINNLKEPLQDIELKILDYQDNLSVEENLYLYQNSKINQKTTNNTSFCSKIFFLWTLIVMKLSNKNKLKKEIIRNSALFNSEKEQDKFREDFLFFKELWEGKDNKGGFNKWKFCPLFFAIFRFNILVLISLLFFHFIYQFSKVIMVFFKRKIIKLFLSREKNNIPNYTDEMFRIMLGKNILCFILIEFFRFLLNHQLKFNQRKITRNSASHISLLIYEKFMMQKLLLINMKEGDLLNYLQTDTESMTILFLHIAKIIIFPFQFITYFIILYNIFGKCFIFGFSIFSVILIFNIIVQIIYIKNQYNYLREKDKRINFTSQTIKNIKELKLLQWEDKFKEIIQEKRLKEMIFMRKKLNLDVVVIVCHWLMPLALCLSTMGAYVKINQKFLNIADLMTALEIFDSIRGLLSNLPERIREVINAYVSLNRIANLLKINTEKDSKITKNKDDEYSIKINDSKIGINENNILMNIEELKIKKSESVVVIGETGSGKSCLIKSLIDRLNIVKKKEFNIDGIVSYASQTPFIINSSIRDNIIFYSKFNEERYKSVIKYCELEKDIECLQGGDLNEIGTNGSNLSGGQKCRINLARCIYKEADIYLLDDPISGVDSIVYNKILNQLINIFLKDKTIIFVTNDIRHTKYFNKVIFVEKGKIKFYGATEEIQDKDFFHNLKFNMEANNKENEYKNPYIVNQENYKEENLINKEENKIIANNGKLFVDEKLNQGRISSKIYKTIIEYSGGYFQLIIVLIFAIIWQITIIEGNIYLAYWSDKKDKNNEQQNIYNFKIYTLFDIICILSLFIKEYLISKMNYNINNNFHNVILDNIINAPINLYHDITPFGQIMNKLTTDLDKSVSFFRHFSSTLKYICTLIGAIIVCISSNKYVLFFLPIISFIGYKISSFYSPAGRNLLRIESIDRAPLLSFYSESIQGIDTIKSLSYHQIDKKYFNIFSEKLLGHFSIYLYQFGARAFFELSLDLLTVLFILFLYIYCIIFHEKFTAISISLLLKYSLNISDEILTLLTHATELENSFVRVERCESATHLPKENFKGSIAIKNHKEFQGNIQVDHLYIKYRHNLDYVLKDISFNIKFGEKICIIGRTGSGKSSIILGLFRILEANKGAIYINNMNIKKIPLKDLRKNLGIVPQEPKIFSGTLKFNLDPMKKYTDAELNNAIKEVGLFNLMKENGRDIRKKLNMELKEEGGNLSIGEKQLICLARIFLRKNNIVVMDEATSNIDNKTELFIENAIDKIFNNSTLIVITHKISNLKKFDKIIVIDNGNLVKFDIPEKLIRNNDEILNKLKNNAIKSN